jgi:hypothetical protein
MAGTRRLVAEFILQGHRMRFCVVSIFLLTISAVAGGQERVIEHHKWSDPEGRIMGYYSAGLAFTPIRAPVRGQKGWEAGLELTYLPPLSREQRSGGFSKTESTNLMPVLPRPRVALTLPWDTRIEASYVPPLPAFGVKASLLSVALSHPLLDARAVRLTARVAGSSAMVKGAITCNQSITEEGAGERLFFAKVCHGQESEDEFHAPAVAGELLASGNARGSIVPYAGLGVRSEQDKFSVGVKAFNRQPDPTHPVLEMSVTRPYGMLGATWARDVRSSFGGELFYAPGSVFTVRLMGAMHFGGTP